jgi:hypothetical protein
MTDRELLEIALQVLDYEAQRGNDNAYEKERSAIRTALSRKALDELAEIDRELGLDDMQPKKQAPYLAVYRDGIKMIDPVTGDVSIGTPHPDLANVGEVGVWGQREWQVLTDDEIDEIIGYVDPHCQEEQFARAIEAKLKEKNK